MATKDDLTGKTQFEPGISSSAEHERAIPQGSETGSSLRTARTAFVPPSGDPLVGATAFAPAAPAPARAAGGATAPTLAVGQKLLGRYYLVKELGRGGMGTVFKAVDEVTKTDVAVKALNPEIIASPYAAEMLLKEAAMAQSLSHPNLLRINHVEAGVNPFIVMEYVDGETLTTVWEESQRSVDPVVARQILSQILSGLDYLHSKRLIHRDIKPDNILVSRAGDVRITDYGIARTIKEQMSKADASGTILYMSPEQIRGEPCDARSDLYSLGIMIFQLVEGRFPFSGTSTDDIRAWHLEAPRQSVSFARAEPAFQTVIKKLIAPDKESRYSSAQEVRLALEGLDPSRNPHRKKLLLATAALALSAIGALAWRIESSQKNLENKISEQQLQIATVGSESSGGPGKIADLISLAKGGDTKASFVLGLATNPQYEAAWGVPKNINDSYKFFSGGKEYNGISSYFAAALNGPGPDALKDMQAAPQSCLRDFWLGTVAWKQGNLDDATKYFAYVASLRKERDRLKNIEMILPFDPPRQITDGTSFNCKKEGGCVIYERRPARTISEWELCDAFVYASVYSLAGLKVNAGDGDSFVALMQSIVDDRDARMTRGTGGNTFLQLGSYISEADTYDDGKNVFAFRPTEREIHQAPRPFFSQGLLPPSKLYSTSSAAYHAMRTIAEYYNSRNEIAAGGRGGIARVCVGGNCAEPQRVFDRAALESALKWYSEIKKYCNVNQKDCMDPFVDEGSREEELKDIEEALDDVRTKLGG